MFYYFFYYLFHRYSSYLFLISLLYYHRGNLWEILLDLCHWYKPHNIIYAIRRIHPLFIKYRKNKPLGRYEKYVLERELRKYINYGGNASYFLSGMGSENCIIS